MNQLIIILGNSCNLDCSYCTVVKNDFVIKKNVARSSVDVFLNLLGEQSGRIKLFGGEPLLDIELLKNVISYIRNKNKTVEIDLSTNGLLLSEELFLWLRKRRVNVSISIDGDRDTQKKNRIGVSDKDYKNLLYFVESHGNDFVVNFVIAPNTVNNFFKNFLYLYEKGARRFNFLPAAYLKWSIDEIRILESNFNLISFFIKGKQDVYIKNSDIENDLFFFNSGIVVDATGEVYSSNMIMVKELRRFEKDLKIGKITDDDIEDKLLNIDFKVENKKNQKIIERNISRKIFNDSFLVDSVLDRFVERISSQNDNVKNDKRIDVKIGYACNNLCQFCVQGDKRKTSQFVEKNKIFHDLKNARENCQSVVFTGGEATIHPDFLDLVKYAKDLDYRIIQIQTNGRMLAYKKFCRKVIEAGANEFSPALHGHTPELHDQLTRAPGSFIQTIEAIKNLKELGQRVVMNTVITEYNYKYLPKIAILLNDLGVDQYQFAFIHIVGSAWKNKENIVPKKSLIMPYVKKGLDIGIRNGKRVMTEAIPYCFMQGYEQYVAEINIPDAMVVEDKFKIEDYKEYRINNGKIKNQKCRSCFYDSVCEGPWKEYVEIFGWDEFRPRKN